MSQARFCGLALVVLGCEAAAAGAAVQQSPPPAERPAVTARAPTAGSVTHLLRPEVAFDIAIRDASDRTRYVVVVDTLDVTEFAVWDSAGVRARPPVPLADGPHAAELLELVPGAAPRRLARVEFTAVAPRRRTAIDVRVSDDGSFEGGIQAADVLSIEPHVDGLVRTGASETRFDATWAQSMTFGEPFDPEAPGVIVEHTRGRARLLAGSTDANMVAGTQFLASRTYRQLAGGVFDAGPAGTVSGYASLAAALPGSGGEAARGSWVQQVAWQRSRPGAAAPRVGLAVIGLVAGDGTDDSDLEQTFDAAHRQSAGVGVLATVRLPGAWALTAESAFSQRRIEEVGLATRSAGAAVRAAVSGRVAGHQIEGRVSLVGPEFGNVADPGLRTDREDAEVVASRREARWGYRARAHFARDGLDGRVARSTEQRYTASVAWRPVSGLETTIDAERRSLNSATALRDESRVSVRTEARRARVHAELRAGWTGTADTRSGDVSRVQASGVLRVGLAEAWSLTAGASVDDRHGTGPSTWSQLYLEPAWEPGDGAWRMVGTLAFDRTQTGALDRTGQWIRGVASRSLEWRWLTATLGVEGRLDERRDRSTGRVDRDGRVAVTVTWNPEATWKR